MESKGELTVSIYYGGKVFYQDVFAGIICEEPGERIVTSSKGAQRLKWVAL